MEKRFLVSDKGASLKDTIEVTALFTLLILPFLLAKLWWWAGFFVVTLGVFGAIEIYLNMFKNTTLTKMFRKYRKEHPKMGLMILICLLLGWLVLLFHLL